MVLSKKFLLSVLICFTMLLSALSFTVLAADTSNATFQYVGMFVGANETERNLAWKSRYKTDGYVMYGMSDDGTMPADYKVANAVANTTATPDSYSYMATMRGLTVGKWVYQLCVGDAVSDIYSFEVYDTSDGFTFTVAGDPQLANAADSLKWSDTLRKVYENFDDVAIVISAGDQGSHPFNEETAFGGFKVSELTGTPAATTVGPAHDNTPFYSDNYNLPNLSSNYGVSVTSSDYYYTYEDVLFVHLNMDNRTHSEHIEFMRRAVEDNPDCKWKILVNHYAFFSAGSHSKDSWVLAAREELAGPINELGFDMVFSGHDHVYSRSHSMLDGYTVSSDVVTDNTVTDPIGTTHICATSASDSKYYDVHNTNDDQYIAVRRDENRKSMIMVYITDTTLKMESYFLDTDTPELFDTFTIVKTPASVEEPDSYNITYVADPNLSYGDDISDFTARRFTNLSPDEPLVPVPKGAFAEGVIYEWSWQYRNSAGAVVTSFEYGEDYYAYLVADEIPASDVMYIANTQDVDNMTYTWANAFALAAKHPNQPVTFKLKEDITLTSADKINFTFYCDITIDVNGYTLTSTAVSKLFRFEENVTYATGSLRFISSKDGGKINAGTNTFVYMNPAHYATFNIGFENVEVACGYLLYGDKRFRSRSNLNLDVSGGKFNISTGLVLVNNYDNASPQNNYNFTFNGAHFNFSTAASTLVLGTADGYSASSTSFINADGCTFTDTYTSDNSSSRYLIKDDVWCGTATFTDCDFVGMSIGTTSQGKALSNVSKITFGKATTFKNSAATFGVANPTSFVSSKSVCADGCVIARTDENGSCEIVKAEDAVQITWANPVGFSEYWKKGTVPSYLGADSFTVGEDTFKLVLSETLVAATVDKTYAFTTEEGYLFRIKSGTEIWQISTDGGKTYYDITDDGLIEVKYALTVTVDGVEKIYTEASDFMDIVTEYSADSYANKEINILFGEDITWATTGQYRPASGVKFNIDLAGHKLTIARNDRISLNKTDFYFAIFSSVKGGELVLEKSGDGFTVGRTGTLVIGSEEYKDNLTVTSPNYFVVTSTLPTGTVFSAEFLYSTFNIGSYGLIRLNAKGAQSMTLQADIKGCNINGSSSVVFYYNTTDLTENTNGGVFTTDSYINFEDSSFTYTGSGTKDFFSSANFADRYFGTVNFGNCTFDKYVLNGDLIYSDEALSYNTYYDTLIGYDPTKAITVGAGCIFRNFGTTFNSTLDDFTANNTSLAGNCTFVSDDDYVMVTPTDGIVIDLGEKQASTNVRFVEVNGIQKEVFENTYIVPETDKNLIVEVTEKVSADTSEIVKSEYYFVDVTAKTVTKLSMDSYMTTDGKKSIRVKEPMGIRFKYAALTSAKNEAEKFVIDEIGFIVAVTDVLEDDELTLDFSKYVSGVAYNKAYGTDIVFDRSNDELDVFTCVVRNIPVKNYKTNLTCKTYTKITVGTEQFVVYGEAITGNIYDTARKLLETDSDNSDLIKIVLDADYSIGIDVGGLYD